MPDALNRTIRTFFQAFLGVFIASNLLSAATETGVVDWSAVKKVALSALAAGVIAVVTYIQNTLEDAKAIPALLKDPE